MTPSLLSLMGVLCVEMAHQNKDDFFLPKGFHVPLIIYFCVREAVLMTEHFLSDFAEFSLENGAR